MLIFGTVPRRFALDSFKMHPKYKWNNQMILEPRLHFVCNGLEQQTVCIIYEH